MLPLRECFYIKGCISYRNICSLWGSVFTSRGVSHTGIYAPFEGVFLHQGVYLIQDYMLPLRECFYIKGCISYRNKCSLWGGVLHQGGVFHTGLYAPFEGVFYIKGVYFIQDYMLPLGGVFTSRGVFNLLSKKT